jgi:hypothetical protein
MPQANAWFSPDAMLGPLLILCETMTRGICIDDPLNLWTVIERALYPTGDFDRRNVLQQRLRDAGAETGLCEFTQPAIISQPAEADESGVFLGTGQIRINIFLQFNA